MPESSLITPRCALHSHEALGLLALSRHTGPLSDRVTPHSLTLTSTFMTKGWPAAVCPTVSQKVDFVRHQGKLVRGEGWRPSEDPHG